MKKKEKNKQVAKIAVFITSIFVIFISVAYAFLNQTLTGTKRQVITAGNLQLDLKEGDEVTLENMLPMYDDVGMIQKEFKFTLTNKTSERTKYTLKLKDTTTNTQKLDPTFIKYGLIKDDVITKDLLSNLTDNIIDEGTIKGNQTINYSLRLWIDSNVKDETLVKGKTLSYQIEVDATLDESMAESTISKIAFKSNNLGENCKTYNDEKYTYLTGRCSKNYVWYSGKLWRVVLRDNKTGAVKMVTENNITGISRNQGYNKTAFEDSYIDQWLTQEFLPTLHDYEDYLVVDNKWDATEEYSPTSSPDPIQPVKPDSTTIVTRTVGLLNSYEYYVTYNYSDGLATSATGYLNNNTKWWLINLTGNSVGAIDFTGSISSFGDYGNNTNGVRPSVNLKSDITTISGDGTIDNPYLLEGDSKETINGTTLLSTRYSGEYINFNNELYRIVGVEDGKTKITAVDKPTNLTNNKFDNNDEVTDFGHSLIKTNLETYYQNDIVTPYKAMIEPNQTWYLGTVEGGENYKAGICKTVESNVSASACEKTDVTTTASIGLPRMGEMFTSQITRETKSVFWTLTPYYTSQIWNVTSNGYDRSNKPSSNYGARPSMYLKADIRIASTNEGNGTYNHPYDIELGT